MALDIIRYGNQGGAARLPRVVARDLDRVRSTALVQAGRIQATEFVAETALHAVAGLSDLEARLIVQTPLADARLKLIVDTATGAMAAEVAGFGGLFR